MIGALLFFGNSINLHHTAFGVSTAQSPPLKLKVAFCSFQVGTGVAGVAAAL